MSEPKLHSMDAQRHWANPLLNLFCRVASRVTPWQWNYYWRNGRLVLRPDR